MLELRPGCERCDKDLPAHEAGAMICSFECTFCEACAEQLKWICPNCQGSLIARPLRSLGKLKNYPASTKRVFKPHD